MKRRPIYLYIGLFLIFISVIVYVVLAVQRSGTYSLDQTFEEMMEKRAALGMDNSLWQQYLPFLLPFGVGTLLYCLYWLASPGTNTGQARPRRGLILSGYLLLIILANLFLAVVYLLGAPEVVTAFPGIPGWAIYEAIAAGLLNALLALAVWNGHRWAVFALAANAIVTLLVNIAAEMPIYIAWGGVAGMAVLVFLARSIRQEKEKGETTRIENRE